MTSISVLLVHYSQADVTWRCIKSLLESGYKDLNIVVVDHADGDADWASIKEHCGKEALRFHSISKSDNAPEYEKTVYWYKSDKNSGYAAGMNQAAALAAEGNPDFLLLLNNDTIVPPGLISEIMTAIEPVARREDFGFASCLIRSSPGNKTWYAGGEINLVRGSGRHYTKTPDTMEVQETGFISGCCMLCRPSVYKKLSGMDESFFLYMEDVDLCLRAKQNGYKLYFVPGVELLHQVGSSTGGEYSEIPVYYSTRNRIRVMHKHFDRGVLFRFYQFFFPTRLLKIVKFLMTGHLKSIPALLRGIRDGFVSTR